MKDQLRNFADRVKQFDYEKHQREVAGGTMLGVIGCVALGLILVVSQDKDAHSATASDQDPRQKDTPSTLVEAAPATYTVQAGDTFNTIAATLGLTPDELAASNTWILDRDVLMVGSVLNVPAQAGLGSVAGQEDQARLGLEGVNPAGVPVTTDEFDLGSPEALHNFDLANLYILNLGGEPFRLFFYTQVGEETVRELSMPGWEAIVAYYWSQYLNQSQSGQ